MSDIYHSRVPWFPALFSGRRCPVRWAVTFGQTTWWTVGEAEVDPAWRWHADCRKRQFARDGKLRFLCRYLGEWFTGIFKYRILAQAYLCISYEVEARQAEKG